jgi:hypothetical protein
LLFPSPSPAANGETGRTDDAVAEAVGMGRDRFHKAQVVVEAAAQNPELQPVVEEMDRTGNVHRAYLQVREAQGPAEQKKVGRRPPKQKKAKGHPPLFKSLSQSVKEVLKDHPVSYKQNQLSILLHNVLPAGERTVRLVAKELAEGKAKGVVEALCALVARMAAADPTDTTAPGPASKIISAT